MSLIKDLQRALANYRRTFGYRDHPPYRNVVRLYLQEIQYYRQRGEK